jgi:hypothetical protein
MVLCAAGTVGGMNIVGESFYWTVERSGSLFQSKNVGVAAAGETDFGGEEFLEGNAFG